jgi:CBS-domain-containing membrane protein
VIATKKSLHDLTAADLMTREVVVLPQGMSLRDAAQLLLRSRASGAPVVDAAGRCVGVLSASDFLRLAATRGEAAPPHAPQPLTCSFLTKQRLPGVGEATLCTLSPGVCPVQTRQQAPDGEELLICSEPHCVLTDWQVVELEKLPADEVRCHMTSHPVTAGPATPIRTLARMMIDVHVHRVIVVDQERKPIGVVSSTDLLAALARDEGS